MQLQTYPNLPPGPPPTLTPTLTLTPQGKYVGPLCKVSLNINGKDIVLSPPLNDIYKYLTKLGRNIVESSKLFVRSVSAFTLGLGVRG